MGLIGVLVFDSLSIMSPESSESLKPGGGVRIGVVSRDKLPMACVVSSRASPASSTSCIIFSIPCNVCKRCKGYSTA